MSTTIVAGNTYTFKNVYTNKMLNLYAGLTTNGTNVCQYTADGSDEQKWTWGSDNKLYIYGSTTKCLDRYNLSTSAMHNNADIWTNNDDTNQKLIVSPISNSSYVTIKLAGTNLFLTAYYGTANGANTEARCAPGATGNVFWQPLPTTLLLKLLSRNGSLLRLVVRLPMVMMERIVKLLL